MLKTIIVVSYVELFHFVPYHEELHNIRNSLESQTTKWQVIDTYNCPSEVKEDLFACNVVNKTKSGCVFFRVLVLNLIKNGINKSNRINRERVWPGINIVLMTIKAMIDRGKTSTPWAGKYVLIGFNLDVCVHCPVN